MVVFTADIFVACVGSKTNIQTIIQWLTKRLVVVLL
jgi:hypothetical protein